MSEKTRLFKQTPFNGYRREDVLEYIKTQDAQMQEQAEEDARRITELTAELEESRRAEERLRAEITAAQEALAAEKEKAERYEAQLEELQKMAEELETRLDQFREQTQKGYRCPQLDGDVCLPVSIQAEKILADARVQADRIIEDAKKNAEGLLNEAESQTTAMAERVAQQSHEMIAGSAVEARRILAGAKEKSENMLEASGHSLGKIRERLTSMQFVLKNVESEIEAAKANIAREGKDGSQDNRRFERRDHNE